MRNKGNGYFLGMIDIAENLKYSNQELQKKEIDSVLFIKYKNKFYEQKIFIKIYLYFKLLFAFFTNLKTKSNFLFCWSFSFMPFNLDFFFLKLANKKVAIIHCGDDVRYRPLHNFLFKGNNFKFNFPYSKDDSPYIGFIRKLFRQKWPLYNNVKILSCRETETFLGSEGVFQAFLVQPKPFFTIEKSFTKPLIIHAPTSRSYKGTNIVFEAINILKQKDKMFEFQLLENISNCEVLKLLSKATIVLDQPGYAAGRLAAEALSYGCIVFNNEDNLYTGFDRKLHIKPFSLNPQILSEEIEKILNLPSNFLQEEIKLSLNSWKNNYSPENFLEKLHYIFENDSKPNLYPYPNHKEKLIQFAENAFQRLMIKVFIK